MFMNGTVIAQVIDAEASPPNNYSVRCCTFPTCSPLVQHIVGGGDTGGCTLLRTSTGSDEQRTSKSYGRKRLSPWTLAANIFDTFRRLLGPLPRRRTTTQIVYTHIQDNTHFRCARYIGQLLESCVQLAGYKRDGVGTFETRWCACFCLCCSNFTSVSNISTNLFGGTVEKGRNAWSNRNKAPHGLNVICSNRIGALPNFTSQID